MINESHTVNCNRDHYQARMTFPLAQDKHIDGARIRM